MKSQLIAGLLVIVMWSPARAAEPGGNLRSRQQFAQAMDKINKGMSMAEVRAALGSPDDISDDRDPGGLGDLKEIWRYGTWGHLTTATLGEVWFDLDGRVSEVFGKGKPIALGLFTEAELRGLFGILARVSSYNAGVLYNPRTVIRAVNELQPLGKERALAVIDEFLRVTNYVNAPGREGIFLVLRTMFDVPDDPGYMPEMWVGAPHPPAPPDKKRFPRFPITVEADIPMLLVRGYALGGEPQQPEEHVAYFREHGRLRMRPLHPTNKPMDALIAFAKSPDWKFIAKDDEENELDLLRHETLNFLDSVYRTERDQWGRIIPFGPDGATRREKILNDVSSLKIRWNPSENQYTFLDGGSLPPRQAKVYRREIWVPDVPGLEVKFVLERESPHDVSVSITERGRSGPARASLVFKVYKVGARDKPLAEFHAGAGQLVTQSGDSERFETYSTRSMELPEGVQVQVELSVNDKRQTSPVLKP